MALPDGESGQREGGKIVSAGNGSANEFGSAKGSGAALADMIVEARKVVVFTGAGISTESGIPDFRSPGGLWTKNAPIEFDDFVASPDMQAEAWRRKFEMEPHFAKARPGKGHMAIAHLAHAGKISHVITQNIDNLHQASGVATEKIIELHGNGSYAKCLECGSRHELAEIRMVFEETGAAPPCTACGGLVKTATISFGQAMPEHEMLRAEAATLNCDLFIAIGSSLVVFPAAGFPIMAKRNGARLVILNREQTDLDEIADLVIHDEIGPVMEPLLALAPGH